jgi:hypothetical protein
VSYNNIDKFVGLEKAGVLKVICAHDYSLVRHFDGAMTPMQILYMSNNSVKEWKEIDRLKGKLKRCK